jgi:hypothetical protein
MVIVSSFSLNHNPETNIFTVISDEKLCCPFCDGFLVYRDSKLRTTRNLYGEARLFSLRRLKCQYCNVYHRELPNIIQPFKHYDSETIQFIIDGSPEADMCAADDSTIRRWKTTFAASAPDISMRLTSVQARISGGKIPVSDAESVLNLIKGMEKQWLAFVMALLINGGHALRTRFAFCPAEFSVKVNVKSKVKTKGGKKSDKTINDSS